MQSRKISSLLFVFVFLAPFFNPKHENKFLFHCLQRKNKIKKVFKEIEKKNSDGYSLILLWIFFQRPTTTYVISYKTSGFCRKSIPVVCWSMFSNRLLTKFPHLHGTLMNFDPFHPLLKSAIFSETIKYLCQVNLGLGQSWLLL